jgi:hypothetical protein
LVVALDCLELVAEVSRRSSSLLADTMADGKAPYD